MSSWRYFLNSHNPLAAVYTDILHLPCSKFTQKVVPSLLCTQAYNKVQYPPDPRYKANAFHTCSKCIYSLRTRASHATETRVTFLRTHLTHQANACIILCTLEKCVSPSSSHALFQEACTFVQNASSLWVGRHTLCSKIVQLCYSAFPHFSSNYAFISTHYASTWFRLNRFWWCPQLLHQRYFSTSGQ